MKINILLCDTFPGLLPDYIPSYTSMFVNLFHSIDSTIQFEEYRAFEGILPEKLSHEDIYLITGCNQAAYDDTEWIVKLRQWIVRANKEQAHMAGICFGHQALALALGGHVERYKGGWGTGIRTSTILDNELKDVFAAQQCTPLPSQERGRGGVPQSPSSPQPHASMHLLYNHHDQVLQLPEGSQPLATSTFCRYEGFRIGNRIVTFQGHPEYTPEYALHLLHNHAAGEDPVVCRKAIESIHTMQHEGRQAAYFILQTLHHSQ